MNLLDRYEEIVGHQEIKRLHQLADRLTGKRIVHVNSTRAGGGVAEILSWMVPLMCELGIDAPWYAAYPSIFYVENDQWMNGKLSGVDNGGLNSPGGQAIKKVYADKYKGDPLPPLPLLLELVERQLLVRERRYIGGAVLLLHEDGLGPGHPDAELLALGDLERALQVPAGHLGSAAVRGTTHVGQPIEAQCQPKCL